jgi:uncharacterized membrane protein (UPF0182 family)
VTRSQLRFTLVLGLVVLIMLIGRAVTLYTDYLWMGTVGQTAVFVRLFWVRLALGLGIGLAFFAWLGGNLRLARRPQPQDIVLLGKRLLPE